MLSEEEVRHVAKLARLGLTDEEIKRFTGQLSNVLSYIDVLSEVETEGVPLTCQVTGLSNVSRADEVVNGWCTREELLGTSELPVDSKQLRVMTVIKN